MKYFFFCFISHKGWHVVLRVDPNEISIGSGVSVSCLHYILELLNRFFPNLHIHIHLYIYNQTSKARTSLGPWKFVRNMGSSSH